MKRLTAIIFATACLGLGLHGKAADKKAAPVSVEIISDGDVKEFKLEDHKDKVVVLEFWATWCPPCRKSIPHLGKLQKEYGDKVVIVGISTEDIAKVKKFYQKTKKTMTYTVAVDKGGATSKGYMKAYNVRGIPHAFIVKGGKVLWHGHPMGMDAELQKAVNGGAKKDNKLMDLQLELK